MPVVILSDTPEVYAPRAAGLRVMSTGDYLKEFHADQPSLWQLYEALVEAKSERQRTLAAEGPVLSLRKGL